MKVCFVLHKHGSNKMCIKMGVFNAFHEYEQVIYLNEFLLIIEI